MMSVNHAKYAKARNHQMSSFVSFGSFVVRNQLLIRTKSNE